MDIQKLLSLLRRGIEVYKLINDNDKIAVGISGGKDSLTLLKLLAEYKKFAPQKFELCAISVDLRFNNCDADCTKVQTLCDELSVPYYVERTDIAEIVFNIRKETNPCSLCSKMRKGALYERASKLNCNKVALGHHADDFIDTFLLSLFYEGRLNTFAPKTFLDRIGLTMIRPMIFIKETYIKGFAESLPVTKSQCPADKHTKRELVKNILSNIAVSIPNIREMIFTAITHPDRCNLFDKYIY